MRIENEQELFDKANRMRKDADKITQEAWAMVRSREHDEALAELEPRPTELPPGFEIVRDYETTEYRLLCWGYSIKSHSYESDPNISLRRYAWRHYDHCLMVLNGPADGASLPNNEVEE